ncbi:hypothetical protein EB796_001523 [Bugula neritina]|uniref:ABC transporter domain-containing protein n=1 Tax=Bugula neritina TaxID=10212 RepID=A0A7J7KPQ7_BUGNE|nr:hypothetical protein EB796_001523 [Bugula neritina]
MMNQQISLRVRSYWLLILIECVDRRKWKDFYNTCYTRHDGSRRWRGVSQQRHEYSLCTTQAWIMNATVRDNILFGKEFDAQKYNKTVKACALLSDFEQLAAGDQTEIGERGINLSGGQKQRISLARAAYSDADLFLLDDPLSAVDAHVGQHLFTHCLKDLLKDKTVLFVTHQLQFLTDCDYILVMKDGQITEEGTHNCLMGLSGGEYSNLIKTFYDSKEHTNDNEKQDLSTFDVELESVKTSSKCFKKPKKVSLEMKPESIQDLQQKSDAGNLTTAEEISHDTVKVSTLSGYLKSWWWSKSCFTCDRSYNIVHRVSMFY